MSKTMRAAAIIGVGVMGLIPSNVASAGHYVWRTQGFSSGWYYEADASDYSYLSSTPQPTQPAVVNQPKPQPTVINKPKPQPTLEVDSGTRRTPKRRPTLETDSGTTTVRRKPTQTPGPTANQIVPNPNQAGMDLANGIVGLIVQGAQQPQTYYQPVQQQYTQPLPYRQPQYNQQRPQQIQSQSTYQRPAQSRRR